METDLTYQCDGDTCEHETDVLHDRGSGVFCAECAARRVRLAFDPAAEADDQAEVREAQRVQHEPGTFATV